MADKRVKPKTKTPSEEFWKINHPTKSVVIIRCYINQNGKFCHEKIRIKLKSLPSIS